MNGRRDGGPPPDPRDGVGRVLGGRYRLLRLVGRGGMASVYLAQQLDTGRQVAAKVLRPSLCDDELQVARFVQEAQAVASIDQENVVKILDVGPHDGEEIFFIMEFLGGGDLGRVLRERHRLPWSQARDFGIQIARGLQAAHDQGIVHRDLKPENCLLAHGAAGRELIKVVDFGIARIVDSRSGRSQGLTKTGHLFGTAKYMAPEQAYGQSADPRTDVYALGVCMYHFLTGQVPFDGPNMLMVLARHMTDPLVPLSEAAPTAGLTHEVEATVFRALAKSREERYASMAEFEHALAVLGDDGRPVMRAIEFGRAPMDTVVAGAPAPVFAPRTEFLDDVVGQPSFQKTAIEVPLFAGSTGEARQTAVAVNPVAVRTTTEVANGPAAIPVLVPSPVASAMRPATAANGPSASKLAVAVAVWIVVAGGAVGAGIWLAYQATVKDGESVATVPEPAAAPWSTEAPSTRSYLRRPSVADPEVRDQGREPPTGRAAATSAGSSESSVIRGADAALADVEEASESPGRAVARAQQESEAESLRSRPPKKTTSRRRGARTKKRQHSKVGSEKLERDQSDVSAQTSKRAEDPPSLAAEVEAEDAVSRHDHPELHNPFSGL